MNLKQSFCFVLLALLTNIYVGDSSEEKEKENLAVKSNENDNAKQPSNNNNAEVSL